MHVYMYYMYIYLYIYNMYGYTYCTRLISSSLKHHCIDVSHPASFSITIKILSILFFFFYLVLIFFLSSFLLILFRSLYVHSERFYVKVPLKQFVLKYLLHNFYFKIMSNQYWIFIQLLSVKNLVLDISIWNIYSIYNIVYYTLQGWKAWIISIRCHQQLWQLFSCQHSYHR